MTIDLFTGPADAIDEAALRGFVDDAISSRLQAESLVIEFKAKRNGKNIVEAVAAMANTDGGIVFVGVDEATKANHLVGITAPDIDAVVGQLRALLPTAMPEVVPVALSDAPGRAVLVLRVDADRMDVPVVLDGRVLMRAPGMTVGARREEIMTLVHRATSPPPQGIYGPQVDVGNIRLWDDGDDLATEVRVHARHTLPRRILGREWLGSPALRASLDALEASPVPSLLKSEHLRSHERHPSAWQQVEVRALRARFRSQPNPSGHRGRPEFSGAVLVGLAGRVIDVVVSIDVRPRPDDPTTLLGEVQHLRELLLGGAVTAVSVGGACALGMDAAAPVPSPLVTAWVGGSSGVSSLRVDPRWMPDPARATSRTEWRFSSMQPAGGSVEELAHLTDLWLTPLLFELGAIGFEKDLREIDLPGWALSRSDQLP